MCADAKMMRLLAAELRATFAARKRTHRTMDPARIRNVFASAAARLGFKQRPGNRLLKTSASSSRQAIGH